MHRIEVLLLTHHLILAELLGAALAREPGIGPVRRARNVAEARSWLRRRHVEVVLADPGHPTDDIFAFVQEATKSKRGAKVLILADSAPQGWVERALAAKAAGFLAKCATLADLVRAIRGAPAGQLFLSPCAGRSIVKLADQEAPRLTARDVTVLRRICAGDGSKAIARTLGVRPKSVDAIRRKLMQKTGTANATQLVRYALEERWIDLRPRGELGFHGAPR